MSRRPPFAGIRIDPFARNLVATEIKDPIAGVHTSEEWKHPEAPELCPVWEPQAAHWQEHSYDHFSQGNPALVSGNCIELARWPCPPGQQGFVRVIETAIFASDELGDPIPNFGYWWPWYYGIVLADWQGLRFFLRLESWQQESLQQAPMITTTDQELPGVPHPALGEWADARYDYSRYSPIGLTVPEGHYLRLFCHLNARSLPEAVTKIWGRLGGSLQAYRGNPNAVDESRVPR